jgi:hypothetical protein
VKLPKRVATINAICLVIRVNVHIIMNDDKHGSRGRIKYQGVNILFDDEVTPLVETFHVTAV